MTDTMNIRPEQDTDKQAIYEVTQSAFATVEYAGGNEQDIVNTLRDLGALSLSLVACRGEELVGHVAFSPAPAADGSGPWYALGPVSVHPDEQRQGIGAALINTGLEQLAQQGGLGCILVGDPAYYQRFGFEAAPDHVPDNEPAEYFMLNCFSDTRPTDKFAFHEGFYIEAR